MLPAQLGKQLLNILQRVIPSDGQMMCGVDPYTLLFNRVLAQSTSMLSETPWFLQHRYLKGEFIDDLIYPNLMRAGLSVVILYERPETSWGIPSKLLSKVPASDWYRAYHDLFAPSGGLLRAFFSAHGQWIAALELVRFEASRPFQPTDGVFLRLLAPNIGRLLSSAFANERALAEHSETGSEASGLLLLEPIGYMLFRNPHAATWINLLRKGEENRASSLPTAVWSSIAQLRALKTVRHNNRSCLYLLPPVFSV